MAPRGKELSKDLIIKFFKESTAVRGIAEIVKKKPCDDTKILWVLLRIRLDLVVLLRVQQ